MTTHSPLLLGLAALVLAACAMAVSQPNPGPVGAIPPSSGTATCLIRTSAEGGRTVFEPMVLGGPARSGTYALTIRTHDGQVALSQSGPFAVLDGRPLSLGLAEVSGRPADYAALLTLSTDGSRLACPTE
jgi:hypothetical protein